MSFSIVIPTYNREKDLNKCLNSIFVQSLLPQEIIIVDDGLLPDNFIAKINCQATALNINLVYCLKNHDIERRGLSESKNKALGLIKNSVFFIFDDDVVLRPDYCQEIMKIWDSNKNNNLIGVGGIIINRRKRSIVEKIFHTFFGLGSRYEWDVNKVGFQVWNEEVTGSVKGYYAHGGACSYCLYKSKELGFTNFSGGRTALEDVDFCLRAKNKGYYFIIQPSAQLFHYTSEISRDSYRLMGFKEGSNRRLIFIINNPNPSLFLKVWFYWASLGWVLRQFLIGHFSKGFGLIQGIFQKSHLL